MPGTDGTRAVPFPEPDEDPSGLDEPFDAEYFVEWQVADAMEPTGDPLPI